MARQTTGFIPRCLNISKMLDALKKKLDPMNYIAEPKDIYSALHPLYLFSRFFCLASYRKERLPNGKTQYKFSYQMIVLNAIGVCLFVGFIAYMLIFTDTSGDDLEMKLQYFGGCLSGILAIVNVIFGIIFAKKLIMVICGFDEVETMLYTFTGSVSYRKIYLDILLHLFGCVVIAIGIATFYLIFVESHLNTDHNLIITSLFFIPYFVNIVMEVQYVTAMRIVKIRFHDVNIYLGTILKKKKSATPSWVDDNIKIIDQPQTVMSLNSRVPNKVVASDPVLVVDNVAALHIKLTDIATWVNVGFSVQLLLRITIAFVGIVTALFVIGVNFVKTSTDDEKLNLNLMFTSWAFSGAIEVWLIVWVTCKVCEEATKCPRLMHKIRNNTKNSKLQDVIEHYSLQMYHNRLKFDVCGLFPLDYTLLYTIIAGVTTYLVILIQFSNSEYLRKNNNNTAAASAPQKPS